MRIKRRFIFPVALALACICGCKKSATQTAVVTADAAPKVIGAAFQAAPDTVKSEATAAATATSNQDPAALAALTRMLQRPDLTGEQRTAIGQCVPAALGATRAAAERGDAKAAEALKTYRASK